MKKLIGLMLFLLALYVMLLMSDPSARSWSNHENLAKRVGLVGVISLGAGCLIISGGIDLSIGSVVALTSTLLALLLAKYGWHPALAIPAVLGVGLLIGVWHGVLVTYGRMQPFIVTLCGLFIYRGLARWLAGGFSIGIGQEFPGLQYWLYESRDVFGLPMFFVILLLLAAVLAVLLHASIHGRYLFAIGSNELAARYAGVGTIRYRIFAYGLCSLLASFYALLYLMEQGAAEPASTGTFLELYAIAGAVLGGCSLRGGDGSVLGILIGATILEILPNLSNMLEISTESKDAVIGSALLVGAMLDELMRRRSSKRQQ